MSYLNRTVLIKNIYYMLTYSFEILKESDYSRLDKEEFDNLENLYSEILLMGLSKQLKHGLHGEYIECRENLLTVKGKIDIDGTIRNRSNGLLDISCNHDEYSNDNIFNQILKTTMLKLCVCNSVSKNRVLRIKRMLTRFGTVKTIDPKNIIWSAIQFRRNTGHYQLLLTICRFVLEGLLLSEDGEKRLENFLSDEKMHKLYERFIRNYCIRHYSPQLSVKSSEIDWNAEGNTIGMPKMISDVLIKNGDQSLILDAKLYTKTMGSRIDGGKKTFISGNMYQIYTYVSRHKITTEMKVTGALIYAKTDEDITPDVTFDNPIIMSGSEFLIFTLDLNTDFNNIIKQLDDLVEHYYPGIKKN